MARNEVVLSGRLLHVDALRHSPAGIPVLSFKLGHASTQVEAGMRREVQCEVDGVSLGETAMGMSRMQAGQDVTVAGFLCRRSQRSSQLVLHVTRLDADSN